MTDWDKIGPPGYTDNRAEDAMAAMKKVDEAICKPNNHLKPQNMADGVAAWFNKKDRTYVNSFHPDINKATGGGYPTEAITLVCAYTRGYKSEFARQSALHAALNRYGVIHVDVELGLARIIDRALAQFTGIHPHNLRKSDNGHGVADAVKTAAEKLASNNFIRYICPEGLPDLDRLEDSVLGAAEELTVVTDKPTLVIFDSVQRLSIGAKGVDVRLQTQAFMHWAEALARKNKNLAAMAISEQRRSTKHNKPKGGESLGSGAESRSLEYVSGVFLALEREERGDDDIIDIEAGKKVESVVSLYLGKNRDGIDDTYLKNDWIVEYPTWRFKFKPRENRKAARVEDAILSVLPQSPNHLSFTKLHTEIRSAGVKISSKDLRPIVRELELKNRVEDLSDGGNGSRQQWAKTRFSEKTWSDMVDQETMSLPELGANLVGEDGRKD
jgi:hypothetical protein